MGVGIVMGVGTGIGIGIDIGSTNAADVDNDVLSLFFGGNGGGRPWLLSEGVS